MAELKLLFLRAYGSGYRGCVIDGTRFRFFQVGRRKGLKYLKEYSREAFEDTAQFIAMMQKFVTPPAFLQPPIPIDDLTLETLDRIYPKLKNKKKAAK